MVVREYVQLLHQGKIEAAKALCTPAASAYLDALAQVIEATEAAPDSSSSTIETIQCTLSADQLAAECEGLIDDGYERYTEQFLLRREDGQWFIDRKPTAGTMRSSEEVLAPQAETPAE